MVPGTDALDVEPYRHPLVDHGFDKGSQLFAVRTGVALEDADPHLPQGLGVVDDHAPAFEGHAAELVVGQPVLGQEGEEIVAAEVDHLL
jgi:hypothetical protein